MVTSLVSSASATQRIGAAASVASSSCQRCCFTTTAVAHIAPKIPPTRPASQVNTRVPKNVYELVQRYPRHPLLAFFRREDRKLDVDGVEKGRTEKVPVSMTKESFEDIGKSGRAWRTIELRTKSSLELHQLWYLCLMERNKLAVTKTEVQRVGGLRVLPNITYTGTQVNKEVAITMDRIKGVLQERRLALLDAQERAAAGTLAYDEELASTPPSNLYEPESTAEGTKEMPAASIQPSAASPS